VRVSGTACSVVCASSLANEDRATSMNLCNMIGSSLVLGLFRGLISVPAPLLGGLIWDAIGPQYVFLTAIGLDLCIRLPLLIGMPETLGGRFNVESTMCAE